MGGKTAQLAFYYQNLFTVMRVLELLSDGSIMSVGIESVIGARGRKEIDIVIELKDNLFEYYEIKSGLHFTQSDADIKEAIKKFILIHNNKSDGHIYRYFLIINPDYRSTIAQVIADLKKISERRRRYGDIITQLCQRWRIRNQNTFYDVTQCLEIKSDNTLDRMRRLCKGKIYEVIEGLVINAGHGLKIDDLMNRLTQNLIKSLEEENGNVNLSKFVEEILDWLGRNKVSSATAHLHNVEDMLRDKKSLSREELRNKFPTVLLFDEIPDVTEET